MKILLFAALFAAASAMKLGSERCTWGPAFWCDNALNAKACGTQAITYCIQNEWSKITVKDDTACSDCKAAVLELKNLLNNATIQKEILDALKNVCSKLGSEALECKTAVDLLGKEVLKQIVNDLDPVKVCALLDLCKNSTSMKLPTKAVATKPNVYASICTDCMQIVSAVQDLMYNQTFQMYVETALTTVCTEYLHLPAELCSYIKIDGSEVFQIIAEALDATSVCNELGICDSKFGLTFQKRVSSANADPCTDCKQVFSDLQDILSNKTVQAYVVKQLEAECEMLGLGKDICEEISTFAPEIFTYLISLLDGEQDCTYLGLCSNGNPVGLKDIRMALRKTPQLSAALCTDCKEIFSDAQNIFSNPQVQLRMLNVVMQVCRVTGPYETMCESYVQMYSPAMITLLLEHVDPASVCQSLDACNNGGALFVSIPVAAKVPRLNGGICDECNKILKDLDEILSDPTVQIKLLNTAISICEALGIQPSDCSTAVNSFGPEIIDEITKELGGGTICSSLGLCTAKGIHLLKHIMSSFLQMQQDASNDDTCSECKEMLADLDDVLNNKTVQSNLFKTLISLCDALGVPATECSSYINTYGPMVVGLITSELDPITVCNDLQLCPASIQAIQQAVIVPANAVSSPDGDVCVECKEMFTDLVSVLNDPSFQTNLFNVLVSLCEALGIDSGSCSSSIYGSGPEILEKIISHLDGNTLCAELGLCTSTGVDLMKKLSLSLSMMQQGIVNADTCSDCKEFVTDLDDILNNQTVQANLFKTLIAVCESLGISSSDCSMYINQYGPVVIGLITSNLDPNTVCNAIQVCPSTSIQPVHQILIIPVKLVQLQRASANADVCSECKEMVTDFISILSNQTVQKNLFKTLEALCQALGISASDCSMYINEFAPVVINAITSNLDPSSACAALGLCPMFRLTLQQSLIEAPVQMQQGVVNADTCSDCKEFVTDLDDILNNKTVQANLFKTLIAVCESLGISSSDCSMYINQYGPVVIGLITSNLDPNTVCNAIQVCPSTSIQPVHQILIIPVKLVQLQRASANADVCSECKEMVMDFISILSNQTVQKNLFKTLEALCQALGISASDCSMYINEFAPVVINAITSNLDPSSACAALGLCPMFRLTLQQSLIEAPVQIPALHMTPALLVKPKNDLSSKLECKLCNLIMSKLDSTLAKDSTQAEIEKDLYAVCSILPPKLKTKCTNFVKQDIAVLIDAIVAIGPDGVCYAILSCDPVMEAPPAVLPEPVSPKVGSSAECMVCQEVLKEVESELSQNATEAEIQKFLDMVCNKIPLSSLAKDCGEFVDDYTDAVILLLLAEADPLKVCSLIGVCTQSEPVFSVATIANGSLCVVCDVVFGIIEVQLEANNTLEEVNAMIEKVCPLLPKPLDKQCLSFLNLYGPMLLKLIVDSELAPYDVCKDLRLCSASSKVHLPVIKSTEECTICKELIEYLQKYLEGANKTLFLDELEKICNLLPTADQQTCKNDIDVFGSYIIDIILSEITPSEVCAEIGVCTNSTQVLAMDPCKIGPTFWCSNPQNAKLCNAVEHCRRHVWN